MSQTHAQGPLYPRRRPLGVIMIPRPVSTTSDGENYDFSSQVEVVTPARIPAESNTSQGEDFPADDPGSLYIHIDGDSENTPPRLHHESDTHFAGDQDGPPIRFYAIADGPHRGVWPTK